MKATDIQIGDWVFHVRNRIVSGFETGGPVRVLEVYEHGAQTTDGFVRYEDLDSIPITPEILEKNGFELISDPGWKQEYMWSTGPVEEYADLYIIIGSDHGGKLRWDFPSLHIRQYKGEIILHKFRYVHELQHALRLCGIQLNITI